ncbi:MAG TPA: CatB-related O-acetyltransferase [Nevskiaceae bacterium]|nr:CatB-related O-acetyltransferase [Nevskiaceae bacterium]
MGHFFDDAVTTLDRPPPGPHPGVGDDGYRDALQADDLLEYGASLHGGRSVVGSLVYERPAFLHDARRLENCTIGAFSLIKGRGTTIAYRAAIGRFAQIAESVVIGPNEQPVDWFSCHPFAFTRRDEQPRLYELSEFERLAPDGSEAAHYTSTVRNETFVGHDTWIGANAVVLRGVRIGDGAIVGAGSVVTQDVPAYAIVTGTPARVTRLRFPESVVERLLRLQWWLYDLAPYKHDVDFSRVERTLAYFEEMKALGLLEELKPETYRLVPQRAWIDVQREERPLYAVPSL